MTFSLLPLGGSGSPFSTLGDAGGGLPLSPLSDGSGGLLLGTLDDRQSSEIASIPLNYRTGLSHTCTRIIFCCSLHITKYPN